MNVSSHVIGWRNWALRHDRLWSIGVGLLIAAAAIAIKMVVSDWGVTSPSYVLFGGAVALATWWGGWPSGVVATMAAGLLFPLLARPSAELGSVLGSPTFLLFIAEALFFVVVVARVRRDREAAAAQLDDAESEIARLRRREQDLQLVEQGFETVAANLHEQACLLLDAQGHVMRWNAGAERLLGFPKARAVGQEWPTLGAPDSALDADLRRLLEAPSDDVPAVGTGWVRRAEGRFHGEVTVGPLREATGALRGWTVIVRDLTTAHASEEFRVQAIATREALQGEADGLAEQLEAIQTVLDPELSEMAVPTLLRELMGRLLIALHADGVAFVDTRPEAEAVLFTAARGLQGQARRGRRPGPRGLRIIQNDAVRARETSAVTWPEAVGLMVTVPVAGRKMAIGALEVVTRRARRWTERDALVLLLAADRVSAVLSGSTVQEPSEPAATVDQIRLSLPQ